MTTLIVGFAFLLIGFGLGGMLSNWAHDNLPMVNAHKPFRVNAEGYKGVVAITTIRFDISGEVHGEFRDYLTLRTERKGKN